MLMRVVLALLLVGLFYYLIWKIDTLEKQQARRLQEAIEVTTIELKDYTRSLSPYCNRAVEYDENNPENPWGVPDPCGVYMSSKRRF